MARNTAVIDVGIRIDTKTISSALSPLQKTLESLGSTTNLSDNFKQQINEMSKQIDELQQKLVNLSKTNVSRIEFANFKTDVLNQIAAVEQRTSGLVTVLSELIGTMSSVDGGKFAGELSNLTKLMDQFTTSGRSAITTITSITESAGKNVNINIIDDQSLRSQVKSLEELRNKIINIQQSEGFDQIKFVDEKDIRKQASDAYKEFSSLINKLKKMNKSDAGYFDIATKAVDAAKRFKEVESSLDSSPVSLEDKYFDAIGKYGNNISDALKVIESQINASVKSIKRELASIDADTVNPHAKKDGSYSIPIEISETGATLATKAINIIKEAQSSVDGHPIEVELQLVSPSQTKKAQTALRKFQEQVNNISDNDTRERMNKVLEGVQKGFASQISVNLVSSISDAASAMRYIINDIKQELRNEPVVINPRVEFTDDEIAKMKQQVTEIADSLSESLAKAAKAGLAGEDKSDQEGKQKKKPKQETEFTKLANQLSQIVKDINAIPKQLDETTGKLPTSLEALKPSLNELLESFRLLDTLDMGQSQVHGLNGVLEQTRSIVKDIVEILGSNASDNLRSMLREWNASDQDMVKSPRGGTDHIRERSAVYTKSGKLIGQYSYGEQHSTGMMYPAIERAKSAGEVPYMAFHTHPNKHIAGASYGNPNFSGDITAWASQKDVEKQITAALGEVLVFDAKRFYETYSNIDFRSNDIKKKITEERKKAWVKYGVGGDQPLFFDKLIDDYAGGFESFMSKYISQVLTDMGKDPTIGDIDGTIAKIRKNFERRNSGDLAMRNPLSEPLIDLFYQYGEYAPRDKFKASELRKAAGLDFSTDDIWHYQLRKLMPQVMESAVGIKASDFESYFERLSIDEFANKYEIKGDILSGLFQNTGIEDFVNQVSKVTDALEQVSNIVSKISELPNGMLNLGFDDTSSVAKNIESITTSLNELLRIYKQLNKLSFDKNSLKAVFDTYNSKDYKFDADKQDKLLQNAFGNEWVEVSKIYSKIQNQYLKNYKNQEGIPKNINDRILNDFIVEADKAGLSLDKFKTISKQATADIQNFKIDIDFEQFEKIVKNTTTLKNSLNSLRKEADFGGITSALQGLGSTLIEFSEVVQKSTGILSASKLNERFSDIKDAAQKLDGVKLNTKAGKEGAQSIIDMYRKYVTAGGEASLEDIGGSKNLQKYLAKHINDGVAESANAVQKESDALREVDPAASSAAEAKEKFANANRELLASIVDSVSKIDTEGKAFENLNKLINNIGSEKGTEKLEKTKKNLEEIIKLLNTDVGADSFIKSLENMASSGDALKDLSSILKTSQKRVDQAKKDFGGKPQFDEVQKGLNESEEYISKAGRDYLSQFGLVLDSVVSKNRDGLIQFTGLVKNANNELKQYTLTSADGKLFNIQDVATNTPAAMKKMIAFEKVRRAYERMNKRDENGQTTDEIVFDPSQNRDEWEQMISLAEQYTDQIGTLQKVTRQVRQVGGPGGPLYESFSFWGDKGHITMGREGDIVASQQDLAKIDDARQAYQELYSTAKNYYALKMKASDGTATAYELQQLDAVEQKYSELLAKVQQFSNEFGANNIGETSLQKYRTDIGKQFDDYLQKTEDKYQKRVNQTAELMRSNQRNDYTPEFRAELENVASLWERINKLRSEHAHGEDWNADELREVADNLKRIDNVYDGIKDKRNILARTEDVDKLISKASKDLNDNSMSKDLTSRYKELINYLQSVRQGGSDAADGLSQIDQVTLGHASAQLKELNAEMTRTGQTGKGFWKQFSGAITSKSANFLAQYFSLQDLIRYGREITQTVTTIDSANVELKKVSNESNDRIQQSFRKSAETAQELGATISEVINSTADWARLGYNVDQAEELARVTTLYQTVGDNMTQESASQSLVSMLQGFHIDASEAERVVDSVNEVANNFPIDTAGIGEALQRSAAAFSAAGTDLNKSIALVTTSNAVVQNPESVGTMFKTMSARIRGAKTELEELGEEEDDYTKTTSKLRDLVKGVTGFDIMKDDNTFKDIYEIILGIGKEWKNLSDIEQASLTEALGGKRGVNTLSAVLNNVDMLEDAYNAAEGASGSAAREQENYAQSVQYSIDRAKASLQQLAVDFMASDFLKGLIETGNTLLKILDQLVNKIGTIPTLLATLGGINFLQGITDPQHGSITTNLISSIFSKNGLLKGLFAGLTGSGASSAVKATSDLAEGVSGGFVKNFVKATTESFKRDNPIPEVLSTLPNGSMVTAVKGYVAPAIEGSVEAAAEAAARRKLGQRLGFSIADDIGSAAVQNAVTDAVTESVTGAVTDTATSGAINAATETVVETGVSGALGKTTGVIATVAHALGPVGLTIAGIAAALAAIGGIAYYKHQKDLEALQKQAHEATKAFEESSKQMDDYASQYSSLYEKMSDKDNTDAETLEYKKQIYALQQEIVALYGGQASGIDLVNGDLETQLNLLEQIKTNMGEEDIVKNQKAYDQAEEEMTKTRRYNLTGFGTTATEGTIGAEIKSIAEQFENQGIKVKDGAVKGTIDIKFEGDARDAYQTLDEFGSKLFELREKYADDDASLYTLNQVIDNVDKAQKEVTKVTDKWQEAYNSAAVRNAEKTSNQLLSRYKDAVNNYNEALAAGDVKAKNKAAQEYEKVVAERDQFLAETDKLGHTNQEKYGFLFDEVEVDKTAKRTSDFAEIIAGVNDNTQDISKTNMFSPERRNQMQDFAKELKEAQLNSYDLQRILDGPWDRHQNISDLEKKIRSLGISFGVVGDKSVEDQAKIQALIDLLSKSGIITDPEDVSPNAIDIDSMYSSFMSDMQKEISQLDTVNAALVSNFSGKGLSVSWDEESGKIVGDVANIREAYGDLAGYDESKLFARLSTGVKMNVGELRKLRAEQEKITRADFARKQEVMTNALADAYERYNAAKTPLDKQKEMQAISNLQQQIKDMRFLESQYDASTSAYQKWLDAQSAGEAGDVYDNVFSTALKRGKELYDTDLLGTEEFRAIAELMSGKDLSSASVQEVVDAYEGFDNTIEGTNHTMRDFLTEGKEGTDRFAESMVDLGFAAKDAEGNISFEDIDIDEMAKKFGTSASLIEAILGKMKDYGWEITFANPDDLGNLDLLDSKINKARESLDKANESAAKPIVSGSMFDPANLTTVEELDSAISTVQSILSHPSEVGIDNSQAVALQELLDALLEKKQLLESSGGSGVINASSINESFTKLEELKTLLGEYDKLDPSVDVSAFIEGDEQVQELATFIAELPPELKTSLGFDINANTQEIIDSIRNGTLYSQANQVAAVMNRANPFDKNGGTSTIREQKIQSVERTEHNKKENETINKTTEQKREETARIEHTEVTASTSGVEEATEEVKELKEETPEELHSEVTAETHGKKDVEDLNKEEQKAAKGASSTVTVSTPGAEKVPQLNNNLAATPDQHTVTLSVVGNGPSTVDAFKRKLDALPAEKRTVITTELRTINTGTHTAGSGGRVTKVNGTANANGTAISRFQGAAHASGNWGTRRRETALMGELGPEILVDGNTGTWHTVGDTGAEFVDVPKGAIIFNHQQTEDLLKHGWVAGRAHVGGTAYGTKKTTSGKGSNIKKKSGSTPGTTGNGGGGNGGGNGGNNNSNSNNNNNNKKKADPQTFDWIERVLNYFQNQFEKFKKLGEYYTTFTYQNAELNNAISGAKTLIKKNETAAKKYESSGKNALLNYTYYDDKGKEKKLTDKYSTKKLNEYWDKLKAETLNGDKYMYIQSIKDENLAKALSEAASYYDKVVDCKNANIDLRHEIMEINRQKLENIVDDYDHLTSYAEACYNLAVAQNDLYEDWNGIGNLGALTTEAKYQNDIIKETRDEVEELQKELLKQLQLKDNNFEVGSESWIEAKKKIREVELQTINAEKQIREINKAIREINWKPFNDAIDVIQHLNSQLDNTISLVSDLNGFDDLGVINQNGITMMNLTASALKEARLEVLDYTQGMKNLNKELEGGRISLNDYNEQMRDYQEKQMSAVLEIKKHRDAILSFIKDGINKETEAMSKLIDKRKEALSRQKEADEYAKSVSDKTKEINKIQRQINAMSGDTTQATIAKVKQLTEQLKNAQDELDETRKNHAVDVLTKGLDDEMKAFQERQEERIKILETSLDEQTKAIDLALLHTTEQYGQTTNMLSEIMKTYGFQLESSITDPWKNAKNAMTEYAEATTPLDKLQEKINSLKQALAEAKLNVQTAVDDSEIDELQQKIDKLVSEYEIKVNANVDATQLEDLLKQIDALQSLLDYKNSLKSDTTEVDSLNQQLDTLSSVANDVNKAVQENTDAISVNTDNFQEVTSVNGDYREGEEGYNEKGEQQRTVGSNPTVTDASAAEKKTEDTKPKTGDKGGTSSTNSTVVDLATAIKNLTAKQSSGSSNQSSQQQSKSTSSSTGTSLVSKVNSVIDKAKAKASTVASVTKSSKPTEAQQKQGIKKLINSAPKHKKSTTAAEKKQNKSALWTYIVTKRGHSVTNAHIKDMADLLSVKHSGNLTAAQKNTVLSKIKKLGFRKGAFQVGSGGWRLTDEEGIGSEAILTKEGVLRQLDAKDTVFNAKQRETLWNLSKMDFSSLSAIPKSSGGISVTNSYGSLLTVNGNVDRDALPELKEILKQACEYTKKDMLHSMQKKGFR